MFHVAVLPGDGIGPEIIACAAEVLQKVSQKYGFKMDFTPYDFGGISIDRHGVPVSDSVLAACLKSDAVLLGAVGGPKWDGCKGDIRPEAGLLKLRKTMNAFANLRPVKLFPPLCAASPLKEAVLEKGIDILILRELLSGIYFGEHGSTEEYAFDTETYYNSQIERMLRKAFEMALLRRKKLCLVDKANVLESSRRWRSLFLDMAQAYPEVEASALYVDNAAMQLVQRPYDFDCIVTSNLFGDILSDEAAVLTGSIGMLPSASLDENGRGIYEPIHGSAPDLAGSGKANPIGTILSSALLLRYSLQLNEAAENIEAAVAAVIDAGYRTADIYTEGKKLVSTTKMKEAVLNAL